MSVRDPRPQGQEVPELKEQAEILAALVRGNLSTDVPGLIDSVHGLLRDGIIEIGPGYRVWVEAASG